MSLARSLRLPADVPARPAQVIDEIGNEAEALAARTISQRGIQLIATAHGASAVGLSTHPSSVSQ